MAEPLLLDPVQYDAVQHYCAMAESLAEEVERLWTERRWMEAADLFTQLARTKRAIDAEAGINEDAP